MIANSRFTRLLIKSYRGFAVIPPNKPKREPYIPNPEYGGFDPVNLRGMLQSRSINHMLKNPIPIDTVHNPLFHLRLSLRASEQILRFVKAKIATWASIAAVIYYFVSPLWAMAPGIFLLSNLATFKNKRNFVKSQVRKIVLLDVRR
jgi:hypothetical protein